MPGSRSHPFKHRAADAGVLHHQAADIRAANFGVANAARSASSIRATLRLVPDGEPSSTALPRSNQQRTHAPIRRADELLYAMV